MVIDHMLKPLPRNEEIIKIRGIAIKSLTILAIYKKANLEYYYITTPYGLIVIQQNKLQEKAQKFVISY